MVFRTEHPIPSYPFKIGYTDDLFFIGSCFSDHIGSFFQKHQFHTVSNPFGTLFNPKSIYENLYRVVQQKSLSKEFIYYFNNQYISFSHQGKIAGENELSYLEYLHSIDIHTYNYLKSAHFLFITFGTAYCYTFMERDIIVANCHKIPNSRFVKWRLTIEEIVSDYQRLFDSLFLLNPALKIIFTVSPVRHLSDGFHENQLSKSILHLAIDQLCKTNQVYYFPSYELIMDDLRDYRFYARDLCHPGENSIEYVEEFIVKSLMSAETLDQLKKVEKDIKRKNHKPIQKK